MCTLARVKRAEDGIEQIRRRKGRGSNARACTDIDRDRSTVRGPSERLRIAGGQPRHDRAARDRRLGWLRNRRRVADRKSTRLNSRHSQISYAVFCLEKNRKN